jgi:hypothetical protein
LRAEFNGLGQITVTARIQNNSNEKKKETQGQKQTNKKKSETN